MVCGVLMACNVRGKGENGASVWNIYELSSS